MSEHSRVLSRGVLSGSGCVRPGSRHFLCALVVAYCCCCCLAAGGSGWASDANSWLLSSACTIDRVPLQAIDVHSFNLQYLERRPVVLEGTDQGLFAAATEKVRFRCTIFERSKDSALMCAAPSTHQHAGSLHQVHVSGMHVSDMQPIPCSHTNLGSL